MPRLIRVIERNGRHTRIHGTKEAKDVFRRVAGQDGHTVPHLAHLLQARGHHLDAGVDLRTGEVTRGTLRVVVVDPLPHNRAVGDSCLLFSAVEVLR